jgi:serine-type D-Ala-D-Ala carboxypeptidase
MKTLARGSASREIGSCSSATLPQQSGRSSLLRTVIVMMLVTAAPAFADPRVSITEIVDPAAVGIDPARLKRIDAIIESAIAAKVTPGAALAIGRHGQIVRLRGYGRTDYRINAPSVDAHTIYDLASLTKPVATTTAVMLLVQDGLLDLDRPLVDYLPEWHAQIDRARMTARHLLTHTSGLPAGGPLAGVGSDRSRVIAFLGTVPLRARPGTVAEYSDYGMILLGALVERLAGERLDALLEQRVFRPLGLFETGFNPRRWQNGSSMLLASSGAPTLLPRIAPTERTAARGHIHGVVHDPLAHRLDGVAGHAGLFGSAHDLAIFADMLLGSARRRDFGLVEPQLLRTFVTPSSAGSRFVLGWERARVGNSSAGAFSPAAFGHTGFTGTSLWIDPERDLYIVLLTNRLNPNSREQRHVRLRRDVHTALAAALRS